MKLKIPIEKDSSHNNNAGGEVGAIKSRNNLLNLSILKHISRWSFFDSIYGQYFRL